MTKSVLYDIVLCNKKINFWEKNMKVDKDQNNSSRIDQSTEFSLERLTGWSSACFESTVDYYSNCSSSINLITGEIFELEEKSIQ